MTVRRGGEHTNIGGGGGGICKKFTGNLDHHNSPYINRPFPSFKNSHFQNEVKKQNLSCENEFHLHENKKSFSYHT